MCDECYMFGILYHYTYIKHLSTEKDNIQIITKDL